MAQVVEHQVEGPEYKPKFHKKQNKQKNWRHLIQRMILLQHSECFINTSCQKLEETNWNMLWKISVYFTGHWYYVNWKSGIISMSWSLKTWMQRTKVLDIGDSYL
jgi:hypothetical protein